MQAMVRGSSLGISHSPYRLLRMTPAVSFSLPHRAIFKSQKTSRLPPPKPCIEAVSGDQILMPPLLHNLTLVEDDQPVELGDGGKTMRNGKHRFAAHRPVELSLDYGFHL